MADTLSQNNAQSWYQWVLDFDKAWAAFQTNYQGLLAQADFVKSHPELQATYASLVSRGQDLYNKLLGLKQTRDTVVNWLNGVSNTASEAYTWLKGVFGLSGLGFLPAIPLAITLTVAAAAITAVTYWLTDAYKFAQQIDEARRLEATGMSPSQAASTAQGYSSSVTGNLATVVKYGAIIALIAIFGPPLLREIRKHTR